MRNTTRQAIMLFAWAQYKAAKNDPNNLSNLKFSAYLRTAWHVLRHPMVAVYDNSLGCHVSGGRYSIVSAD